MLFFVVVIYNKTVSESLACQSLLRQNECSFRTVIYDNSDGEYGIRGDCEQLGWTYLGGNGNTGLPKAYNAAAELISHPEDALCLLDDDTELPENYAKSIQVHLTENGADILLPIVSGVSGKILSPWREMEKGYKRFFQSEKECCQENASRLLAFNSGMVVRSCVFPKCRFDERLFLDFVDISFLKSAKDAGFGLAVIPEVICQQFSGETNNKAESDFRRFSVFLKDLKTYFGDKKLQCSFLAVKRAAHLSLLHKSTEPFAVLLRKKENGNE